MEPIKTELRARFRRLRIGGRFLLILESVVRSLVRLLPFAGSALEQAIFGTKDAIQSAELRSTVEEIRSIVIAFQATLTPVRESSTQEPRSVVEDTITGSFQREGAAALPFVDGYVILQRLNVKGCVSFLVDTGADQTVLSALDGARLGIDYNDLQSPVTTLGIGGTNHFYREKAVLVLSGEQRAYVFTLDVLVGPPSWPEDVPSILGRDVLNRLAMNYNAGNIPPSLTFRVLSSDSDFSLS